MKVSREQLKQIIQEELQSLQQEGEVDEGLFSKFFGQGDSPEQLGFVTSDKVEKELDNVQAALSKLKSVAKQQDNKQLSLAINPISDNVAKLYNIKEPKGPKVVDSSKITAQTLSNLRTDLEIKKKKSTDELKSIYNKLFHGATPPQERKELINKIMSAIKTNKDYEMVNSELFNQPRGTGPIRGARTWREE